MLVVSVETAVLELQLLLMELQQVLQAAVEAEDQMISLLVVVMILEELEVYKELVLQELLLNLEQEMVEQNQEQLQLMV